MGSWMGSTGCQGSPQTSSDSGTHTAFNAFSLSDVTVQVKLKCVAADVYDDTNCLPTVYLVKKESGFIYMT